MATWAPQVAPIASWLTSALLTPAAFWMACVMTVDWSLVSGSVWIRMVSLPEVFAIGFSASAMPLLLAAPTTAAEILSALACVVWPAGMETRYSTPPLNSMP